MSSTAFSTLYQAYLRNGFCDFATDSVLLNYCENIQHYAEDALAAASHQHWYRHGRTWFVGVNVMPNNAQGQFPNNITNQGQAFEFIDKKISIPNLSWDRGQLSVCYPGYPQSSDQENSAAYAYRIKRDAAHIDGLLAVGEQRRRMLQEHHGFILGIALNKFHKQASPTVYWQGSHHLTRDFFQAELANIDPSRWHEIDITEGYQALRREIFANCERRVIAIQPGQAFLLHPLCLHGMAPWQAPMDATNKRMVLFFRPEIGVTAWAKRFIL